MQNHSSTKPAFLRLDADTLARTDARVLKAQEVEQRLSARELLDEAAAIVEQAKLDREEECKRGYAEGFEAGQEEALRVTTHVALLVSDVVESWMNDSEQKLTALLMDAFTKLIGQTPQEDMVRTLVNEGLTAMGRSSELVIKVAEPMVSIATAAARNYAESMEFDVEFDVVADLELDPADVIIQTSLGVIDLRGEALKSQLSSMLMQD